ncbi:MAG: histidine phosphatase family protein [Deltaproteobacteria bacterium]|nr:histidine phosphatase family protein [Deltaproteobacteria bacterium]
MVKTRLYLIRHGQTINTPKGVFRYNGYLDVDITREGITQMESVALFLKERPLKNVYSSDLIRAFRGAKIIASYHGLIPVVMPDFREIKQGLWEGLTFEEIISFFPLETEKKFSDIVNYRIPGGENFIDAHNRVIPKIESLMWENKGSEFVVVAHGGVNMIILAHYLKMELKDILRLKQDFGCINIIDFYDDFPQVRLINGNLRFDDYFL